MKEKIRMMETTVTAGPDKEEEDGEVSSSEITISNVFEVIRFLLHGNMSLLRHKDDVEEKAENFVMAALFCASEEGNVEGLKDLVNMAQHIDLQAANRHGETAVHMAASGGHTEVIRFLQSKGVDISVQDKHGDSAVYWAARQGHVDVIRYLKEEGISLDTQNKSGEAAIHVAARYGHATVVDFLSSVKANINLQDNLGEAALHNASWHGFARIVQTLCNSGAQLDTQNKDGDTPLHCAASRGHIECVRILLEAGAPLNQQDKRGSTALYNACNRHHSAIASMLIHAGCDMDLYIQEAGECVLHCAAREGLVPVVQNMCAYGCKVDVQTQDGVTALHIASKAGHTDIVRCLLISGACPNPVNKDGVTPEIMALAEGYSDISDLLNKVKGDRGEVYIRQLLSSTLPLSRVKLKILGSTGVGKSTLIETLKCGLFSSFFRRSRVGSSGSSSQAKGRSRLPRQYSLPTPLCYAVGNPVYTKGIHVQQVNIAGVGDLSIWDFSGYEPYYMAYDHFLGDTNSIHVVMFNLTDPFDEQLAQVYFWMNFIKARAMPQLPLGHCGKLPHAPKVLLLGTHADKAGCPKNARSEYVSPVASSVLAKVQHQFQYDLDLVERVFVCDAQVAMSADIKALKQQLYCMKSNIVKNLPRSCGFLEAMLTQLPSWKRSSSSFPVLSWQQFTEYVRSKVNPLAGEEDLRLLVQQLQMMGEIVYLESDTAQDLVVLHPKWLCSDILGHLISHEKIIQSRITGCFTVDDFQLMYPETDALDLLQVLEAMELCIPSDIDGEIEYEFPCLNFVETLNGLWHKDKRFASGVYGGVKIQSSLENRGQLRHLFMRIQVALRKNFIEADDPDSDLYQWHHGSKYCTGDLEGILLMDKQEQYFEVRVRGAAESRTSLFYFQEDLMNIIEQVITKVTPGLYIERCPLSPSQLKEHLKTPIHSFSPKEILTMQYASGSRLRVDDNKSEEFIDVVCMGSEEAKQTICFGLDLPISHLTLHTRRKLCRILDPQDPMGRDWCLLAVTLGLEGLLPNLDSTSNRLESKTDKTLEAWANYNPHSTIQHLLEKLHELNREDAAEVVLQTCPLFKLVMYEDHSTDESATPGPASASTNTLSNLSR